MIKFTLGAILLALTLFFGGKEVLSSSGMIENRKNQLNTQLNENERALASKQHFAGVENKSMLYSTDIENNIINQLNIKKSKHSFSITDLKEPNKILTKTDYRIVGFDSFSNIFNLISDIEKIHGLTIEDSCLNCEVKDNKLIKLDSDIGFKIEGKLYVYKQED